MSDFKREGPSCGWAIYNCIMKKKPQSGARLIEDSDNRWREGKQWGHLLNHSAAPSSRAVVTHATSQRL